MPVFFLQVELDPVMKTDDFCSRFCLSNKDMFKSWGVLAAKHKNFFLNCINTIESFSSECLDCVLYTQNDDVINKKITDLLMT